MIERLREQLYLISFGTGGLYINESAAIAYRNVGVGETLLASAYEGLKRRKPEPHTAEVVEAVRQLRKTYHALLEPVVAPVTAAVTTSDGSGRDMIRPLRRGGGHSSTYDE